MNSDNVVLWYFDGDLAERKGINAPSVKPTEERGILTVPVRPVIQKAHIKEVSPVPAVCHLDRGHSQVCVVAVEFHSAGTQPAHPVVIYAAACETVRDCTPGFGCGRLGRSSGVIHAADPMVVVRPCASGEDCGLIDCASQHSDRGNCVGVLVVLGFADPIAANRPRVSLQDSGVIGIGERSRVSEVLNVVVTITVLRSLARSGDKVSSDIRVGVTAIAATVTSRAQDKQGNYGGEWHCLENTHCDSCGHEFRHTHRE